MSGGGDGGGRGEEEVVQLRAEMRGVVLAAKTELVLALAVKEKMEKEVEGLKGRASELEAGAATSATIVTAARAALEKVVAQKPSS